MSRTESPVALGGIWETHLLCRIVPVRNIIPDVRNYNFKTMIFHLF